MEEGRGLQTQGFSYLAYAFHLEPLSPQSHSSHLIQSVGCAFTAGLTLAISRGGMPREFPEGIFFPKRG